MNWFETGRFLLVAGAIVCVVGVVFMMADKVSLGRLPVDFSFGTDRFRIYVPLATCILLSIILTLIFNFFSGSKYLICHLPLNKKPADISLSNADGMR